MSVIEQHTRSGVIGIKERAVSFVDATKRNVYTKYVLPGIDNLLARTEITYVDGFADTFQALVRDPNAVVIAYANHTHHINGITMGQVTNNLTFLQNQVVPSALASPGFQMIIASTLPGHQGDRLSASYEYARDLNMHQLVSHVLFTREKDEHMFDDPLITRSQNARELVKLMQLVTEKRYNVAVFPEGTVEGGRKGQNGEIKGMQQVGERQLASIGHNLEKKKKKVLYVPIGMVDGHKVLSPDGSKFTTTSATLIFGIGREPVIAANVGMPVTSEQIKDSLIAKGIEVTNAHFNAELMRRLLPLLPPNHHGVYSE